MTQIIRRGRAAQCSLRVSPADSVTSPGPTQAEAVTSTSESDASGQCPAHGPGRGPTARLRHTR